MAVEITSTNYEIFKSLNIKFKDGQVNSIIGPNRSGKTTLISLLKNEASFRSIKVTKHDIIVVSNKNINETVREEIYYYLEKFKVSDMEKNINSILMNIGLDETYLDKRFANLSTSEIQKVLIACALLCDTKVIVFDDILCFDYSSKKDFMQIIRTLKNQYHKTIILATNDVDFAHKISDYIYVIFNGQKVFEGTKYEVFTNFEMLEKYGIEIPNVIKFSKYILDKKGIKIGYRDDINDLIKDIYRYK